MIIRLNSIIRFVFVFVADVCLFVCLFFALRFGAINAL